MPTYYNLRSNNIS